MLVWERSNSFVLTGWSCEVYSQLHGRRGGCLTALKWVRVFRIAQKVLIYAAQTMELSGFLWWHIELPLTACSTSCILLFWGWITISYVIEPWEIGSLVRGCLAISPVRSLFYGSRLDRTFALYMLCCAIAWVWSKKCGRGLHGLFWVTHVFLSCSKGFATFSGQQVILILITWLEPMQIAKNLLQSVV